MPGGVYVTALSQFQDAVGTVWVTDGLGATTSGVFYWELTGNPTLSGTPRQLGVDTSNGDVPVERHLDTCNVLFTDGHVKAMKLDKLTERSAANANVMRSFTIEDD